MAWTAPTTFTDGLPATAAALNALVTDLQIVGNAWTDDTASRASTAIWTTTGASLGNGTLVSRYRLTGKTLDWLVKLTFGSTTTAGSSQFAFTYPGVTALNTGTVVTVRMFDNSASNSYMGMGVLNTATVNAQAISSAAGLTSNVDATTPFTWATSDVFAFLVSGLEVA